MPLAYRSLSHGFVPFGFFNVATDMVLLADHFMFASDLCSWVGRWAQAPTRFSEERPSWVIADRRSLGNLHGAMRGDDLSGFIGATYARYPFPPDEAAFKQDPEGYRVQAWAAGLIERFSGPSRPMPVVVDDLDRAIALGPYRFDPPGFSALILYLWRGGMPRWREEMRPHYVLDMMDAVRGSPHWLFGDAAWPE
jgi:hypothetical protein